MAAIENVQMPIPHVENTAVVTMRLSMNGRKGGKRTQRTVSGDGTQARDERNLEAALAHDAREARIRQLVLLELLSARRATVLERASGINRDWQNRSRDRWAATETGCSC